MAEKTEKATPTRDKAMEADILKEAAATEAGKTGAQPASAGEVTPEAMAGHVPANQDTAEPAPEMSRGLPPQMMGTNPHPGQVPIHPTTPPPVIGQGHPAFATKKDSTGVGPGIGQPQQLPAGTPLALLVDYLSKQSPLTMNELNHLTGYLHNLRCPPTQSPAIAADIAPPVVKKEADSMNLHKYGKDYVIASKNGEQRPFTRIAWDRMGGAQNKDGWAQVVKAPPEVSALLKKA